MKKCGPKLESNVQKVHQPEAKNGSVKTLHKEACGGYDLSEVSVAGESPKLRLLLLDTRQESFDERYAECKTVPEQNPADLDGGLPELGFIGNNPDDLSCVICGREFKCKINLSKHMKSHSARRPFKCPQCPKTFRTGYDQRKHSICHDEGFSYACEICKFKCKSKQALKHHRLRKHDNSEYQFTCDKCSKQFKIKTDLTTHIKYHHTDHPPLICEVCGESFKASVSMSAHKRKHRKDLRKFTCEICQCRFKSEHNLNNHLLLHEKGITCNECGMKFDTTKRLSYHKKVKHKKLENYMCSICHKPFRSTGSLRSHILTHTGERPYKCDLCGESFTQRSSMMRHRRSHPGRFSPPPPIPITAIVKDIEEKVLSKN